MIITMGTITIIIIAAVAGVVAGVLSNWIYDILRGQGRLPDNPTMKRFMVVVMVFLPLIVVSVLPDLLDLNGRSAAPALYQVRVVDAATQANIPNAKVMLESTGVPQVVYTDSNGLAIIQLPTNGTLTLGRLIIDAPTYQIHTEQIDFHASTAEVKTIQLNHSQ